MKAKICLLDKLALFCGSLEGRGHSFFHAWRVGEQPNVNGQNAGGFKKKKVFFFLQRFTKRFSLYLFTYLSEAHEMHCESQNQIREIKLKQSCLLKQGLLLSSEIKGLQRRNPGKK